MLKIFIAIRKDKLKPVLITSGNTKEVANIYKEAFIYVKNKASNEISIEAASQIARFIDYLFCQLFDISL